MSAPAHDVEKGLAPLPSPPFLKDISQQSSSATLVHASTPNKEEPVPALTIPHKTKVPASRSIKFQLWFNTYRKLFTFVVTFNFIGLVLAATGTWQYPRRYTGAFVLGNLQMAILMRNELFGRFLYLIVNTFFAKWPPLWFRLGCTSLLQHLGGIHSGCATSGTAWLVFRVVILIIDHSKYHPSILATGITTALIILISIASAMPWMRDAHHNIFEGYHRILGWLGLLFTWAFVILGDSYDTDTHSWSPSNEREYVRQQDFWFVIVMTVLTIIPWVTLRKVPVVVEIPSPKAAIIRFERGMQQGLLARISRGSLLEFHAFGTISKGVESGEHYLICGVQGDFTQSLVEDPPTHLWTRELKFAGVSNTTRIYKRGIRVCTGTGLGAALSSCLQSPDWYLIWMGSGQEKTFGKTISALIRDNLPPEQYTLWDSKERGGRPDVMQLIRETYVSWGAEVVFITSNLGGNTEMMEGCKREGIPAFGTLWDF